MAQDVFDLEATEETIRQALAVMDAGVAVALQHLAEIEAALAVLEEAGMYPALPSREVFEPRPGMRPVYLYLYWRQDGQGGYEGPRGKHKTYVGCKVARIAEARRLVENRRRWEALERTRERLEGWLDSLGKGAAALAEDAASLARESGEYPRADLAGCAPADAAALLEAAKEDVARQRREPRSEDPRLLIAFERARRQRQRLLAACVGERRASYDVTPGGRETTE